MVGNASMWPVVLAAAVLGLAACSSGVREAQLREEALRAEEARRAAELAMKAPPPPPPVSPFLEDQKLPYEKVFPEVFRRIQPVRIGVFSSRNRPQAGQRVALLLQGSAVGPLGKKLGKPVRIAFISRSTRKQHSPHTEVLYRPGFLQAAIQVAKFIPFAQGVRPMKPLEKERKHIDLFIYVGEKTP